MTMTTTKSRCAAYNDAVNEPQNRTQDMVSAGLIKHPSMLVQLDGLQVVCSQAANGLYTLNAFHKNVLQYGICGNSLSSAVVATVQGVITRDYEMNWKKTRDAWIDLVGVCNTCQNCGAHESSVSSGEPGVNYFSFRFFRLPRSKRLILSYREEGRRNWTRVKVRFATREALFDYAIDVMRARYYLKNWNITPGPDQSKLTAEESA